MAGLVISVSFCTVTNSVLLIGFNCSNPFTVTVWKKTYFSFMSVVGETISANKSGLSTSYTNAVSTKKIIYYLPIIIKC